MHFTSVETRDLVKMFGPTRALAGVSLTFREGTITTVEGPNGSGKSTLISILARLAEPSRGQLRYGSAHPKQVRGQIGLLSHDSMLYPSLSGRANLRFFANLYGVREAEQRIDSLVDRFEIGKYFERATGTYSRGQLQRVALARAILHNPTLLLLDEPSTGLDQKAIERLELAVLAEKERGAILVMVSHNPRLVERLSDHRVRLDRGKVVEAS